MKEREKGELLYLRMHILKLLIVIIDKIKRNMFSRRKLRIKNYNNALRLYHALCENVSKRWKVDLTRSNDAVYIVTYKPADLNVEFDAYIDYILITHNASEIKVRSIEDCITYCNNNIYYTR